MPRPQSVHPVSLSKKAKRGKWFAAALIIGSTPATYSATTYKFTSVVQDGDVIAGKTIHYPSSAALNDSGVVVFDGDTGSAFQPDRHVYRKFLATQAPPSVVADGFQPAINNPGTILFACSSAGVTALCTESGTVVKVGDTIGGQTISGFEAWAIGNNGGIVFTAALVRPAFLGAVGLFTPSALLLKGCDMGYSSGCVAGGAHGDSISGTELLAPAFPTINSTGNIIFFCGFGTLNAGICTPSSILAKTGSVIGGHMLTLFGSPSMNSLGMVAFSAGFDPNSNAMFTPSSVVVQAGATIAGHMIDFVYGNGGRGFVNDSGTVVFSGHIQARPGDPQGQGIFTQTDLVIRQGDTIEGKTVYDFVNATINNRGVVLLTLRFAGPSGLPGPLAIVAAEPQLPPPPQSILIVIKEAESPARVNASSHGKIPVAILSNAGFDAPAVVERTSLTFGHSGEEHSLAFCDPGGSDVNGDRLLDLVCHFETQIAAFQASDTHAVLKGQTRATPPSGFTGSAAVRVAR